MSLEGLLYAMALTVLALFAVMPSITPCGSDYQAAAVVGFIGLLVLMVVRAVGSRRVAARVKH